MRPFLSVAEPALLDRIIDEACHILATTGMEIRGDEMRRRLVAAGLPAADGQACDDCFGVRHLRDPLGVHEAGDLDPAHTRGDAALDQLDLLPGAQLGRVVLQAVAGRDLDDRDVPHGVVTLLWRATSAAAWAGHRRPAGARAEVDERPSAAPPRW